MTNDPRRRLAILDAAFRVFTSYGPRKTTVADIAREAHIGVGTVYLEFRSKNAILRAISHRGFERVHREMAAALQGEGPARDRLRRALTVRVTSFLAMADGRHGQDLFACGSRAIEAEREAFLQAERQLLTRFLADAHAAGELVAEDPELLARVVLQAYRAFAPPQLFEGRDRVVEELAAMHQLVLEGLLPRP